MKKILKPFLIGLSAILFILVVFAIYVYSSEIPYYDVSTIEYEAKSSPKSIERGKKLTTMLCANCHLNRETGKLTGIKMTDAPPEFGEIYSQNITQDKTYGIGNWSDGELLYLLRTGVKKNGQYSPPYMAKLPTMADEDLDAIISFLRSDNEMVKADATKDTPTKPSFLTKLLSRIAWKPLPLPKAKIYVPDSSNTKELGRYLANNLECFSCHSADFKTNNFLIPESSEGYFGGGNKPLDMQGRIMLTANLTPDKETGIGNWTKEKFVKAVKYGIKENEPALSYPMMPYSRLNDYEVEAIFEYLKTIPPIKNKIERSIYDN